MANVDSSVTNGHHDHRSSQTWGVPWSPLEFVEQAAKAKHPMQLDQCLPCRHGDMVKFYKQNNVRQRVIHRASRLNFWLDRANRLAEEEATLHTRLHADIEAVIRGKRLLLWKEMMQSISYEDQSVFDQFVNGAMLVGAV